MGVATIEASGTRTRTRTDRIVIPSDCVGLTPQQQKKIDLAIEKISQWKNENVIIAAVDMFQPISFFRNVIFGEAKEARDESLKKYSAEECKELCDVSVFLCSLSKKIGRPIETHAILIPNEIGQRFSNPKQFYPMLFGQINGLQKYPDKDLSEPQKDLIKVQIQEILQSVLTRFKFLSEGDFAKDFLVSAEKTVLKNERNRQKSAVSKDEVEKVFGVTPEELEGNENLAKTVHHYFEVLNRALRDVVKQIMPQSEYDGMPENLLAGFLDYFSKFKEYRNELVELLKNVPNEHINATMMKSLNEKRLPELLIEDVNKFYTIMSIFMITFARRPRYKGYLVAEKRKKIREKKQEKLSQSRKNT